MLFALTFSCSCHIVLIAPDWRLYVLSWYSTTRYDQREIRKKHKLTPVLALAVAGLISLVTPTNTSLLNSLDKTTESASALLESAFIGEDENSARRGSSGDESGEEVMDDKKMQ